MEQRLKLHDIENVFSFLRWRLDSLSTFRAFSEGEKEDAYAAMLEATVKLSEKYDPECGLKFSTVVGTNIPHRLIDYQRKYIKDIRYKDERETEIFFTDQIEVYDSPYWDEEEEQLEEHELLQRIDVEQLSELALDTLYQFAVPLYRGADIEDLADLHGVKVTWIRRRLTSLEQEINGPKEIQEVK